MLKWRADSVFGPGMRVLLDGQDERVFRAGLQMSAYRCCGKLTLGAAAVGRVLVNMQGADGRLDPSRRTLATLAAVSLSTVDRALARLRECGFLTWTRRLIRDPRTGWRCEQTSNAYVLRVPPACERQNEAPVGTRVFKQESTPRKLRSGLSDRDARENAARQLEAMGYAAQATAMRASG